MVPGCPWVDPACVRPVPLLQGAVSSQSLGRALLGVGTGNPMLLLARGNPSLCLP